MYRLCGNYYQYRRMAMKNNKNDIIKFFVWMRNGIAFCTTWLLIIGIVYCHISNQQQISVSMLTKLLFFVIGGVSIFNILFTKVIIKNWTFTKRLTCFMVLFSLYECLNFYWIGFFSGTGTFIQWLVFIGIVCVLYSICIAIYQWYSNKQGEIYTQALMKYQQQRRKANGK